MKRIKPFDKEKFLEEHRKDYVRRRRIQRKRWHEKQEELLETKWKELESDSESDLEDRRQSDSTGSEASSNWEGNYE